MGRKITIDKAPAWVVELEGKLHKAALRGLQSAAQRTVSVIQNEIIPAEPRMPVDRGIYRAGWRARKVEGGALVYNATPAAGIIEDGARAENIKIGKAMIDALAEWVIRKGFLKKGEGQKRGPGGKNAAKATQLSEARSIAWAIAMSMKKHGIFNKGQGLKILAKARRRIPAIIEEEVRREIANMPK